MSHSHRWWPVPGEAAEYVCACGATGERDLESGEIREHKKPRAWRPETTVRQSEGTEPSMGQDELGYRGAPGCSRVAPKKGAE